MAWPCHSALAPARLGLVVHLPRAGCCYELLPAKVLRLRLPWRFVTAMPAGFQDVCSLLMLTATNSLCCRHQGSVGPPAGD